jgi:hypothetical protein
MDHPSSLKAHLSVAYRSVRFVRPGGGADRPHHHGRFSLVRLRLGGYAVFETGLYGGGRLSSSGRDNRLHSPELFLLEDSSARWEGMAAICLGLAPGSPFFYLLLELTIKGE